MSIESAPGKGTNQGDSRGPCARARGTRPGARGHAIRQSLPILLQGGGPTLVQRYAMLLLLGSSLHNSVQALGSATCSGTCSSTVERVGAHPLECVMWHNAVNTVRDTGD